jgi:hypothetical protein
MIMQSVRTAVIRASAGVARKTGNTVHARIKTAKREKSIINQVTSAGAGLKGVPIGKGVSVSISIVEYVFPEVKKCIGKRVRVLKWWYWSPVQ